MATSPTTATTAPILIPPREAARLLGISSRKLWSMSVGGEDDLPYVRLGRLVRYDVGALRRWVAAQSSADASRSCEDRGQDDAE
jgi:predicted DNA-binding transcriptional regulator AlpA